VPRASPDAHRDCSYAAEEALREQKKTCAMLIRAKLLGLAATSRK
jgi:hypothetical protein